jgi:hypothetical protein
MRLRRGAAATHQPVKLSEPPTEKLRARKRKGFGWKRWGRG